MKCTGCNREAKYMVHQSLQPHCEECFRDSVEDCTVPTMIMTVDGYMKMKEALRVGKNEVA